MMAQLPPKAPPMTQNWHSSFPYMTPMSSTIAAASAAQHPSWIDEFLDFSSVRRNSHRRSASDSIAFVQLGEDCRNSHSQAVFIAGNNGFEKLDDEQLMNMFPDDGAPPVDPTMSSSNPSTPSDQNSVDDDRKPKSEPGEVDSSCKFDMQNPAPPSSTASSGDNIVDPKRVKRILANRQSAQRSRVRKLQYISELERSVSTLQTEVSALSPRVAFLDHQRLILNVDNSALKQRIAALAQDKIFKDAHQEALKKEIERLRQVYHQQSLKKMGNTTTTTTTAGPPPPAPPSNSDNTACTDKEQIPN